MALVVVDNGESVALQLLVNKITTPENLKLKLYTNNITPGETDVAGTYTEASGNGYALITLTGASWSVSGTAPTSIGYAQQTFTFTGALGNVYGYFLVRASTGDLILAERFSDGPYNIQNNGDTIKITPTITCD
jgi:hypothetical protein